MWYWKPFKSKFSFYSAIISELNFLVINLIMLAFLSTDEKKLPIIGWVVISMILTSLGASWVNVLLQQLRAFMRRKEISEIKQLEKINVQESVNKIEEKKSEAVFIDSRKISLDDVRISKKIELYQNDESDQSYQEMIKKSNPEKRLTNKQQIDIKETKTTRLEKQQRVIKIDNHKDHEIIHKTEEDASEKLRDIQLANFKKEYIEFQQNLKKSKPDK